MKKLYTSNYARQGSNPLSVGTSCVMPKWYTGMTNSIVAPTWDLVRRYKQKEINSDEYSAEYLLLLESRNFDAQQFVDKLPDGAMLLCYEPPGEFCHRRLLAKWIDVFTDTKAEEWRNEKEEAQFQQMSWVDQMLVF